MIPLLLLGLSLLQTRPAPDATSWPPPGVHTMRDGATRPEVLRRVEPRYTAAAMRARIQGFVTLQFVVEIDGAVGPVRVMTSLDRATGLDDEAVAAVKQWLFKPGLKDGVPARVMASAVLAFSIRELGPPIVAPAGFDAPEPASMRWVNDRVESDGLVVQFSYPDGWQRPDSTSVMAMMSDPQTHRSVGIFRPAQLPAPIPFPMPLAQLARFSETIRAQQAQRGQQGDIVAVGQTTIGGANWLWLELELSTAKMPNLPPEAVSAIRGLIDSVRVWSFSTSVGSRLVQVMCSAPYLKGAATAEETGVASARTDCAGILKRISFTTR